MESLWKVSTISLLDSSALMPGENLALAEER